MYICMENLISQKHHHLDGSCQCEFGIKHCILWSSCTVAVVHSRFRNVHQHLDRVTVLNPSPESDRLDWWSAELETVWLYDFSWQPSFSFLFDPPGLLLLLVSLIYPPVWIPNLGIGGVVSKWPWPCPGISAYSFFVVHHFKSILIRLWHLF